MILYETPEGRVCIAFVWLGKPLIGSTDIRIRAPDAARCDDSEIDYMLAAIRTPFPGIRVDRSQILSTFSGIRPLAKSSAAVTGQVSRSHHCAITEPGAAVRFPVYSMIGGKWTPFRAFAQQVADRLLRVLAQPRRADSRSLAIGGGRGFPRGSVAAAAWQARLAANTGVPADRIQVWFRRYGTRAAPLAAFAAAGTDAPLHHHSGYTRREIEFMLEQERVCHLDDILLRRTGIALLGELTEPLLLELADIAATALGWSAEQTRAEQDRAREILRDRHHVTPR
jgi:glycerol-3-phosphate dehydrogenase